MFEYNLKVCVLFCRRTDHLASMLSYERYRSMRTSMYYRTLDEIYSHSSFPAIFVGIAGFDVFKARMLQRATLKRDQQLAEWVCCRPRHSPMLEATKGKRTSKVGRLLLEVGGVAVGFMTALLGTFRNLFAAADSSTQDNDTLGSSIRGGDLNFRTGKFDDGTNPAGWYGRD